MLQNTKLMGINFFKVNTNMLLLIKKHLLPKIMLFSIILLFSIFPQIGSKGCLLKGEQKLNQAQFPIIIN